MSDVISAVLGDKQRILMEALADYNKNVEAARVLNPNANYTTLRIDLPAHQADTFVRPIVSKRVAVSQTDILNWMLEIEGQGEAVKIDYEDSNGTLTRDRVITVSQIQNRGRGGSRYRPVMVVAWDVQKGELRNFVLTRIQRVESVD